MQRAPGIQRSRRVGLSLPVKHTLAPVLELSVNGLADYSMPIVNHYDSPFSFHRRTPEAFLVGYHPGGYETASRYDAESVPERVPASIRRDARSALRRFFPRLGDAAVVDEWTGVRSVTPDGNPIISPTSVEGFPIAAFQTSGTQLAPGAGKLVAAQILGESEPAYADQVSLTRFTNHDSENGADDA